MGEEAIIFKARYFQEGVEVNAAGIWEKVACITLGDLSICHWLRCREVPRWIDRSQPRP